MNCNGLFHTNCYSFSPLIEQGTAAHMNMNTVGSSGWFCCVRSAAGWGQGPTPNNAVRSPLTMMTDVGSSTAMFAQSKNARSTLLS